MDDREEELPKDVVERVHKAFDGPIEIDLHQDRTKEMKTPGFMRFPTDWDGPYADVIRSIHNIVDSRLLVEFASAYKVLYDIYEIVRIPEVNTKTGEVMVDEHGWPVWKRDPVSKIPIEDYSRLTIRDKDDLIHRITAHLFEWEQKAAAAWAEAMFSKAIFEEEFALAFNEDGHGRQTDATRENRARSSSSQERFFGVFKSYYSRKADAICRSMTLIDQRLKDTTV